VTRLIVDPVTQHKLAAARETVELCDHCGRVLGHFIPAVDPAKRAEMEPRISEEELQRRETQGGGRPLAAILADLNKRT
jgi:hypothetical protein